MGLLEGLVLLRKKMEIAKLAQVKIQEGITKARVI